MTEARSPVDPESLLAHREWVRAVARSLVSDRNVADDLEQSAWLAAFSRPPRHDAAPRSWLAAVVRNIARNRTRGETRRRRREDVARRREAQQRSVADLVVEADLQRRLARAVLGLPEVYREVILLRFFDDETASEIAARLGVSVETVRTRQKRALHLLRQDLRDELGDDWQARCALVAFGTGGVPHAPASPNTEGPATGAARETLMNPTTITLSAAASVALLVSLGTWQVLADDLDTPAPAPHVATSVADADAALLAPGDDTSDDKKKDDETTDDASKGETKKGDDAKDDADKKDGDGKGGASADGASPPRRRVGGAGGPVILGGGGGGARRIAGGFAVTTDPAALHGLYAKQMGLDDLPENAKKALAKAGKENALYTKAAVGAFTDENIAAMRKTYSLRKLAEAARWDAATKAMKLTDAQVERLKAAVKARDEALQKAYAVHEFEGPKGTLSVPTFDGAQATAALATYFGTCTDLLDTEQRKVWKSEGYDRAFGNSLGHATGASVKPRTAAEGD